MINFDFVTAKVTFSPACTLAVNPLEHHRVTSHLFNQLSVLNIDLLPTKNYLRLAAVGKFFLISSHDSCVIWIYPTNVSADVQSHLMAFNRGA